MQRWHGTLFFGGRWALYTGPVAATELHAHHAHQVVLSAPPFLPMRDASGRLTATAHLVIPADVPHAIGAAHPRALMLFLDRETALGRRVATAHDDGRAEAWQARGATLAAIAPPLLAAPPETAPAARAGATLILDALAPTASDPRRHPALRVALEGIERALPGPVRAAEIARAAALSESRLMHLLRAEIGLSLRAYVRWARMRLAVAALERGATLGASAHFGLAPSALSGAVAWVAVDALLGAA